MKDLNNKEEITEVDYNHLFPCDSRHNPLKDQCPSFLSILSAINTPSYKLVKLFTPLLTPLTSNNYTIKDSFSFGEEISFFDSAHYMISFDFESLFSNIALEETIISSYHFEEQWMSRCPVDYKPFSYRRYVDDHFCYFRLNCT